MKEYSAYLFDLDGTLVQSERLKGLAISEACNYFGHKMDLNIYKNVMGESWEVVTNYFFRKGKINPQLDEFNVVFRKIYEELISDELILSPNVNPLLNKLLVKKKKLGVVSSASKWMVDQILLQVELFDIFDIIITQEQVVKHKPDPEAYLLALKQMGLPGSEVLVFEDTSAGLRAATKAACDTIAIQHEFNTKNDLSLAIKVITDFDEFPS